MQYSPGATEQAWKVSVGKVTAAPAEEIGLISKAPIMAREVAMNPVLRNLLILISAPSSSLIINLPDQAFLNPLGHFGFTPVTFLVAEPFTHVMETRFLVEALGVLSTG